MSEQRDVQARLSRIEAALIEQREVSQLGHRIVYDTKSGKSTNMAGCSCSTELLDEHGYQVKLDVPA